MKKLPGRDTVIHIVFYGGLVIKAVDALLEFTGGFMLMILSHDQLNRLIHFIAFPELREDPNDIVMNYFITLGQNFSISSQHSAAIYLLLHGAVKLAVLWALWKKKLWAYPISAVIFGLFIAYEIYSFIHSPSVLLPLLIIVDTVMIVVIILEYRRLKADKAKERVGL